MSDMHVPSFSKVPIYPPFANETYIDCGIVVIGGSKVMTTLNSLREDHCRIRRLLI